MKETRIVIMGAGGVGKSALTLQFIKNEFKSTYDPTIEETYSKTFTVDGQPAHVEILDTAGTEQFMALKELYMKSGHGFVLVFSLAHLASVNELGPLREQIVRVKNGRVPTVIVGNKADLRAERQVPREIGTSLSRAWGNVPYYESSARKRINVDEVFADIVRQCRTMDAVRGSTDWRGSGGGRSLNGASSFGSGNAERSAKRKKGCVIM